MIILSNSIAQVVQPGQSVVFDTIVLKTGNAEMYRPNTSAVTCCCKNGLYNVEFSGNIGSTTAATDAQLNVAYDQTPLLETTAISMTTTAGDLNNVSTGTSVRNECCCCGRVSVVNTGTEAINIGANPKFKVNRIG